MANEQDPTNLGAALTAYMQKTDISGKELARRIGIGESTLTRIRQGLMPDADGLLKIMLWLVSRK